MKKRLLPIIFHSGFIVIRHSCFVIFRIRCIAVGVPEEPFPSASRRCADMATVTLRKVTLRLIPFLFILYIVAWLDRVNVGFAAVQVNGDIGLSSAAVGLRSGVVFVGYCVCA